MPPNRLCPCCGVLIPDWHFEWHTKDDQREIVAGRKAMECPLCKVEVHYDLFDLSPAPGQPVVAKRDVAKAAVWANFNNGTTLKKYLETEQGHPYADQWNDAEVEKADNDALTNP